MKIELKKIIKIKTMQVIADVKVNQSISKNIIAILKFIKDNDSNTDSLFEFLNLQSIANSQKIIESILEYLRKLKLLTSSNSLTPYAQDAILKDQFLISERGKYKFLYFEDSVLGNILLTFERVDSSPSINEDELSEYDELKFDQKEYLNIKDDQIFKLAKIYSGSNNMKFPCIFSDDFGPAFISWRIDSNLNYTSEVFINNLSLIHREKKLLISNLPNPIDSIVKFITDRNENLVWERVEEKFSVRDIHLLNNTELFNFVSKVEYKDVVIEEFGEYEEIIINDIPLTTNTENFYNWFLEILENNISINFISKNELFYMRNQLMDYEQFKKFKKTLQKIDSETILTNFIEDKNFVGFWHVQSAIDLSLKEENYALDIWNINNEDHSIYEVVTKIVGGYTPEKMVFFSKYLDLRSQIAKFELFAESFKSLGAEKIILVSKNNVELKNNGIIIKVNDQWTHDRHFAFMTKGQWFFYKMTGELDQCRFESNDIKSWDINTPGTWQEISFLKLNQSEFPEKLISIIEES